MQRELGSQVEVDGQVGQLVGTHVKSGRTYLTVEIAGEKTVVELPRDVD